MKLYDELKWRGLINDVSSPEVENLINNESVTFYIGTDPTGDSLHIGHFSSFLIATRLKAHGHKPIILVGGATGQIGDPKPSSERPMITKEKVEHNFNCLKEQVKKIFDCEIVNNNDWCKDITFIDFLRDYGKYFNINYMLNKDIVRRRLDTGITYTEFSYMIIQALDFLYLYEHNGVTMQVAGQDQWGNITAGIDLIRKKTGKEAYAFTMPLITKSDGTKFGKSEGGKAVWLDKEKTSSYELYQFLINVEDSMVIDYLKKLTFLSVEEIIELEKSLNDEPHLRLPHKALAKSVITFLHGEEEYEKAVSMSEALFKGNISNFTVKDIEICFKGLPVTVIEGEMNLVDALLLTNACSSKREAREFINNGAISINGNVVKELDYCVSRENAIGGEYTVVRRGKKNYYLINNK